MSHFAKIENDLVTNVIVAEQAFIDTMPGEWIQTSYNTYGGVHYGPDGQPDAGVALRKNYAGMGHHYDRVNDAFYAPRPTNLHELNQTSFLWVLKAEYTPLIVVKVQSPDATLPVGVAGSNIVVNTVDIRDQDYVLFPDLSSEQGVYKYTKETGLFTRVPFGEFSSVIIGDDYSTVYKYVNIDWVAEAVQP